MDSIQAKNGLLQLLMDFDADFFVTLTYSLGYTYDAAKRKLKQFHAELDRLQLGKSWSRSEDRTKFVAVPEVKGKILHHHLLLKLPAQRRAGFDFENSAPVVWKKITPAGTFDAKPIRSREDHAKEASYMTKDAWLFKSQENFVLSSEFIDGRNGRKDSVSR